MNTGTSNYKGVIFTTLNTFSEMEYAPFNPHFTIPTRPPCQFLFFDITTKTGKKTEPAQSPNGWG